MPSYNLVVLMGHLTRNPELLYAESGVPICKFGLAVNHRYGSGENKQEEVCFVDVTTFGKTAEFTAQYFQKGHCAIVTGRLTQEHWEKDGQKRSKHAVIADKVGFAGDKKDDAQG